MSQTTEEIIGTEDWETDVVPDFGGFKVFILGGAFYGDCVSFFASAGFEKAEDVEEADVVVFIGGADVDPAMYNQEALDKTHFNRQKDDYEQEVFLKCVELDKPMFGICRGAQFLHVMNGGQLWQHVENHAGKEHWIVDLDEDLRVLANSYHHQMLMANSDIQVLAVCEDQVSKKFQSPDLFLDLSKEGNNFPAELEIEAGAYEDTKCFFVQGHPEVGNDKYRSWCLTKFFDLLYDWEESEVSDDDED